jgi:hypothetical protein
MKPEVEMRLSHIRGLFVVVTLGALVMACSSSDSGSPSGGGGDKGSCSIVGGKSCFDYPGSGFTAANVQTACDAIHGTHSATACTADGRVGSCRVMVGSSTEQIVRYYASGFTAASAQTNCTAQSGVFTAG